MSDAEMKNVGTSSSNDKDALSGSFRQSVTTKPPSSQPLAPNKKQNDAIRNSLLAGSAAGITSTIVCHPFDVLRVKMQTSAPVVMASASSSLTTTSATRSIGLLETLRDTIRYGGGARALYTGLAMPLAAQAVYKGTVFTINNMTESFIREWNNGSTQRGVLDTPYQLTPADRFISGFMGGAVNAALFCTPVEYIRNQQIVQIQNIKNPTLTTMNDGSRKNGPLAVIRRTVKSNGFAGLWRGMTSTILRDSVGCGFFFLAMAYPQEQFNREHPNQPPKTAVVILSGVLAGVSYWLWALPVDTMKTWIQNGTARNISDAVQLSQRNGIAQSIPSLFRGWQVAYSRGAPSAAITVLTYSVAFQYLQESS